MAEEKKKRAFRHSFNFYAKNLTPDQAFEGLEAVKKSGSLTPRRILDSAIPEGSLLHPAFEWDNSIAGEQFRMSQASSLITSVVEFPDPDEQPQRVYGRVVMDDGPRYVEMTRISRDKDMLASYLDAILADIHGTRRTLAEINRMVEKNGDRLMKKNVEETTKKLDGLEDTWKKAKEKNAEDATKKTKQPKGKGPTDQPRP